MNNGKVAANKLIGSLANAIHPTDEYWNKRRAQMEQKEWVSQCQGEKNHKERLGIL